MRSMQQRLEWCVKNGDLTLSDLATWMHRPVATVRTWLKFGRVPMGPPGRLAFDRLDKLENAIKSKNGLPVPADISWSKRAEYIAGVRDVVERNGRVPKMRTAV